MKNFNDFLKKLDEQVYSTSEQEETKNLAKEDALALIAEFVKDVKKKFSKQEDKLSILRSASKTLEFYINEIESEPQSSFDSTSTSSVDSFDTFEPNEDEDEDEMEDVE